MDLLIVTHRSSLVERYGAAGERAIVRRLDQLKSSYVSQGRSCAWVSLDDASALGPLAQADRKSRKGFKQAIDHLFATMTPAALWIVGGPDVVPFQRLKNPLWTGNIEDDPDEYILSDLPYASSATFGNDVARYGHASRVVARVGDQEGATSHSNLVAWLREPAVWQTQEAATFFALSAAVWRGSTQLSIQRVMGGQRPLSLSPPEGPAFTAAQLAGKIHLVNCHGNPSDPTFYGQTGRSYPAALSTSALRGKLPPETVAAFECCYGAELYPVTDSPDRPICLEYLSQAGAGVVGSTNVAYGPSGSNDNADLICGYFLEEVKAGHPLGEAFLRARQRYAAFARAQRQALDPTDLKTLAQFVLYGNPLAKPVAKVVTPSKSKTRPAPGRKAMASVVRLVPATDRAFGTVLGDLEIGRSDDLLTGWRVKNLLTFAPALPARGTSLTDGSRKKDMPAPTTHVLFLTSKESDTSEEPAEALLVINEARGEETRRLLLRR